MVEIARENRFDVAVVILDHDHLRAPPTDVERP
jgi:hypothetical protein